MIALVPFALAASIALRGVPPQPADGRTLYATRCASCHGANMEGTDLAPALGGISAAAVDFQLSTGRMPKHVPYFQSSRQPAQLTQRQISALVAYVVSAAHGPAAIPEVSAQGDLVRGKSLFTANCAACHGASGTGGAVGYGWAAPSILEATPTQIAEAVRSGPAIMPRFDERALSPAQLSDIVAYVESVRETKAQPGGLDLGFLGPVAEGAVAWVVGLGLILIFVWLIGTNE